MLLVAASAWFVASTLLAAACTHRYGVRMLRFLHLPTQPAPLPDDDTSLVGFLLVDVRPLVSSLVLYIAYKYFIRYVLLGTIHVGNVASHVERRFQVGAKVTGVAAVLRKTVWKSVETVTDSIISTSSTKLGLRPTQGVFVDAREARWLYTADGPVVIDSPRSKGEAAG